MSDLAGKQPAGTYVTAITVASANGIAGSSSGGATPALTLTTSITGILKGNGTAISAAPTTGSGNVMLATSPMVTGLVVADVTDPTKTLLFNTSGNNTGGTTTLVTQSPGVVSLTLPGSSDTLVGRASVDVLTNKSLSDSSVLFVQAVDNTKTLTVNLFGTATGTNTTLAVSSSTPRTITLPNATDTLVGKATTDVLTNKSISGLTNTLTNIPSTALTGTVAIANGGTGQITNTAAFDALSPMTSAGDLIYGGTSGTGTRLAAGTSGQFLKSTGTTSPTWVNAPQGLKNYIISNADIEQGSTTGYSLGTATLTNNFPSGVPTFGSGASGNLSLSTISSGQLAGTYSLGYLSSAATTVGNFVATNAFSVDLEGQAKVMAY